MLSSLREETEGKLQMLLLLRKNGQDSLTKEVRVFKDCWHSPKKGFALPGFMKVCFEWAHMRYGQDQRVSFKALFQKHTRPSDEAIQFSETPVCSQNVCSQFLCPLTPPPPNQQSDGFPLEFLLKGPQTELRTLSQNCEQTLSKLRTKRILVVKSPGPLPFPEIFH